MCNHPRTASGFTLLELIVAISIAGILMAMAIPSFQDLMRNNRLTTYANEFVTTLNLARSEAVKRGVPITARKISAAGTSTHWGTSGWNVFVDTNKDGVQNTATNSTEVTLRTYDKLPSNFSLIGNGVLVDSITYIANGSSNSTAATLILCDNSDGNGLIEPYTARAIIISMTGRIQMARDNGSGKPKKNDGTTLTSCTP